MDVLKMLQAADVFFGDDEDEPELSRTLNMNDTFAWALAYGEHVSDEEMPEVGRLFKTYGDAGLYYWCSEKNDQMRSEFFDVQRAIDFVRNEERIRKEVPDYDKRAYHKAKYTIG